MSQLIRGPNGKLRPVRRKVIQRGASRIVMTDYGMKEQIEQVSMHRGLKLSVGVHRKELRRRGQGKFGVTNAQVAEWNEFGVPGRVPQRSFLRSTFDEHQQRLQDMIEQAVRDALDYRVPIHVGLSRIGLWWAAMVQGKITTLRDPPNAPSTIRAKGSSNPLIDTGQLRQAITYELKQGNKTIHFLRPIEAKDLDIF